MISFGSVPLQSNGRRNMDTVAIDLAAADSLFRANGSVIIPGFLTVLFRKVDDKAKDDSEGKILPPMEVGDTVTLNDVVPTQHFTEPPHVIPRRAW